MVVFLIVLLHADFGRLNGFGEGGDTLAKGQQEQCLSHQTWEWTALTGVAGGGQLGGGSD